MSGDMRDDVLALLDRLSRLNSKRRIAYPAVLMPEARGCEGMPLRHWMQSDEWYASLDPGIRFAVKVLHASGVETGQSCEGGRRHAYDVATVDLGGGARHDAAGFAALAALTAYGLPVRRIGYVWNVEHGTPYDSFWRIEFAGPMHDRADDWPSFVQHYRAAHIGRPT